MLDEANVIRFDRPIARKLLPMQQPARYKGLYGGRASMKSHFFAEEALERMLTESAAIVCIREVQKSLAQSVKRLLEMKIEHYGLEAYFESTKSELRSSTGGLAIFQGMQDHTADSIKSLESFDIAYWEEAHTASDRSLRLLRPTMRKPGCEMWFSWNPELDTDPVDVLLRGPNRPRDSIVLEVNWRDNPFFPPALREEREEDFSRDPDTAFHVWEGGYLTVSKAQVLHGKYVVEAFVPGEDWDGPYHGLDWGFSTDPTSAVKCWVHDDCLFIEYDFEQVGLELNDTAEAIETAIPGISRHTVRADSARPESISHVRRDGVPQMVGVDKWPGSVEEGVRHLRSYRRIVIHPRCEHAHREARLWAYRVDKRSNDILPVLKDGNDHVWDAVRYALAPLIKVRGAPKVRKL